MAITYHAGRRIQGLSSDILNTPTYSDDFSSDNKTGSANSSGVFTVDIGDERIEGTINRSVTNRNLTWDLQTIMSESIDSTAFVLTFKLQILTNSNSTNTSGGTFIALTSVDQNSSSQSGQDSVSIQIENQGSGGRISGHAVNSGTLASNADWGAQGVIAQLKTFYVKFAKDDDTTTITIAYDEGFTDLYHTVTNTTSGITGLRYFKIQNYTVAVSTYDGVTTFAVDDLKVYNGVSSLTNKPTNVQVGSRFEETDTRKMYSFTDTPTYETDFSSSTGWTFKDSAKASISGGSLSFDFEDNSGNDDSCYYDLGSTMSDTKWLLRFKINWTTFDDNSRCWFGLASNTTAQSVAKDFIGLLTHKYSGTANWESMDKSNASLDFAGENSSSTTISTSTDYWVQIRRLTDTTYDIKVYDDSDYTSSSLVDTVLGTMSASSISGLQYIMFYNRNDHETTYNQVGTIDDLSFYNGVTTVSGFTEWKELGA